MAQDTTGKTRPEDSVVYIPPAAATSFAVTRSTSSSERRCQVMT